MTNQVPVRSAFEAIVAATAVAARVGVRDLRDRARLHSHSVVRRRVRIPERGRSPRSPRGASRYDPVVQATVSTATLESGWALSYAEQGDSSRPAVVLLPGPTDSWLSYEPVLARLPESVRAIAVSQRGHGDSDKPATGYRVEDFAADVLLFLDALGIERAVLAGHSGSCLVARRVAIDQPERVAGLVLEASPTTLHGHAGLEGVCDISGLGPGRPD